MASQSVALIGAPSLHSFVTKRACRSLLIGHVPWSREGSKHFVLESLEYSKVGVTGRFPQLCAIISDGF